jgi:DNA-binding IclR family transcriptional regulator
VEQLFQDGPETPGTLAVDRSAQLLLGVLASERPVSVTELARLAGLPKSTSSRLLRVLARRGLVGQDGPRGLIHPGPAILTYARRGLYERTIVELAQPSLDVLAQASGETINLAVPGAGGVEHLAQVDGRHFLGTGHWVGRRVDFHCSAVGKVFLAHGAAVLPDGPLPAPAPRTVTDRSDLADELREVRSRGHATAIDELEAGLAAVAAPGRGGDGDVVAALAISGPTLRLGADEIARLVPTLRLEARRLGHRLGHPRTGEHAA